MWISVLIFTILCLAGMSCRPPSGGAGSDESTIRDSEVQAEMKGTDLSREQILDAANKVAKSRGRDPDQMDVFYDEGNAVWRTLNYTDVSELADKDYQAVAYSQNPPVPEGGFWVLIDKKTGKKLKTVILD